MQTAWWVRRTVVAAVGFTDNCIEIQVAADNSWAVGGTVHSCGWVDALIGDMKWGVRVNRTLGIVWRIRIVACCVVSRRLLAILSTCVHYSLIVGRLQTTIVDRWAVSHSRHLTVCWTALLIAVEWTGACISRAVKTPILVPSGRESTVFLITKRCCVGRVATWRNDVVM